MKLALNSNGQLDIQMDSDGAIIQETSFETVILTSLLWNRRADPEDILPFAYQGVSGGIDSDRQGWVGDILDEQGRMVGSKLWLLDQELAVEETKKRAIEYVKQALKWAVQDGYVTKIDFDPKWSGHNRLDLGISVFMTNGNVLNLRLNLETGAVYVI